MLEIISDLLLIWGYGMLFGTLYLIMASFLFRKAKAGLRQGGHIRTSYLLIKLFLWTSILTLFFRFFLLSLDMLPHDWLAGLRFGGQEWLFDATYRKINLVLFLIWGLGLIYHSIELTRRNRMVRDFSRLCEVEGDPKILKQYHEIGRSLGLKKLPILMTNQGQSDAYIYGILHPLIVIPHGNMSHKLREITMYHELLHYRNHHLLYRRLIDLLYVVFWFVPGSTSLLKAVVELQETLCDLEVCEVMGQAGTMSSKLYYEEVVSYAITKRSIAPSAVLAKLVENYCELMERIQNVLYVQKGKRRYGLVALVTTCLVMLLLFYTAFNVHPVDLYRHKSLDYHLVSSNSDFE